MVSNSYLGQCLHFLLQSPHLGAQVVHFTSLGSDLLLDLISHFHR